MSTVAQSSSEALEQRPKALTLTIEDLMDEVRRGRLRIPAFQRSFRWKRKNAQQLLDSVARGYPIGTLLFWEKSAESMEASFGSVRVSGAARSDAYWVVDGQQRVVSLVRALLPTEPDVDLFALYYDLEARNVVVPPSAKLRSDASRWLPMTEVVSAERLQAWAFQHASRPEDEGRRKAAFEVGRRVREYQIPAYVVKADNDVPLREIFGRVNSLGVPMKEREVFDALNGARSSARPATTEQVARSLDEMGFGRIDAGTLYRLLKTLRGDFEGDVRIRLRTSDESDALYARTAAAARSAIEFLRSQAGIPHVALLPYAQTFLALAKFFDLHPQAERRSRSLLARWLWRGALNGTHRGDIATTRRMLAAVDDDETASVQRLLKDVDATPLLADAVEPGFNVRHAGAKLEVLALLDLRPRDVGTGRPLTFEELGPETGAWSLPKVLRGRGHALGTSVANRVVHAPRVGLDGELRLLAWVADGDPTVLRSHGIDADAQASLASGDDDGFLVQRQRFLRHHFEAYYRRRARWGDNDRPSIASLMASVEAD